MFTEYLRCMCMGEIAFCERSIAYLSRCHFEMGETGNAESRAGNGASFEMSVFEIAVANSSAIKETALEIGVDEPNILHDTICKICSAKSRV